MLPFPPHFETLKFEKYSGKGDLRDHIRELFKSCIEVAYEETYLMCLFAKSLGGQALEWFSHLPSMITSWGEFAELLITNYANNINNLVSLIDLYVAKQNEGESFASFL